MTTYHFAWDLEYFGYFDHGMTAFGGWKLFANSIASFFLFLVGLSLVIAHANGIRWRVFWKRLAMVSAAAAAITSATWYTMPDTFIFFGIMHQIAFASVVGLAFLRAPPLLTLVAAVLVILAPNYLRNYDFNHPALLWVVPSTVAPRSNDFVPVFPWFGVVLVGIGLAGLALKADLFDKLARVKPGAWSKPLDFFGRHSLAFYFIHQPVLISLVWTWTQVFPVQIETSEVSFLKSCQTSCEQSHNIDFCKRYCVCMLDRIKNDDLLDRLYASDKSSELKACIGDTAVICTEKTYREPLIEEAQ